MITMLTNCIKSHLRTRLMLRKSLDYLDFLSLTLDEDSLITRYSHSQMTLKKPVLYWFSSVTESSISKQSRWECVSISRINSRLCHLSLKLRITSRNSMPHRKVLFLMLFSMRNLTKEYLKRLKSLRAVICFTL